MKSLHQPVLLPEAINLLDVKQDHWYIDCNLGSGGHAEGILKRGGRVLAIDVDPVAIDKTKPRFNNLSDRIQYHHGNFSHLKQIASGYSLNQVAGIIFDLGLSSDQLADIRRGFSFSHNGPLDMRLDPDLKVTAADLVNSLNATELEKLFKEYGEETFSKQIAQAIILHRKIKAITTTLELVDIILLSKPKHLSRIHPATLVFQALRIAVNDELDNLRIALPQALDLLSPQGRLIAITFHSLEDRIVKNFLRQKEQIKIIKQLTKKPISPGKEEVKLNPRSRSAKLRAAIKLPF